MRPDRADVLVIGSGAAGAAITKRLAEKGAKVVCLEQGDWRKPGDYPSAGYDIAAQFLRPEFSFSPNTRKRLEDYPIASAGNNPPDIEMVNAVGGTTTVWACEFLRLRPSDFRTKMLDGVAQDWPLGYRDLEKYYALNERETGVSGMPGDPGYPGEAVLLPPLPLDAAGHIAAQTLNRLGWHWWIFNIGFLSRPYEGRPACDLNTPGWYGCGPASRASTDVTYWPRALRLGAILRPWARVREITVDASGRAKGAVYYDERGDLHEQLARVVVVCANGIGTPRLLLNSKSKLFPQGLANSSGLLGKGLMLHVWLGMRGVLTACTDSSFASRLQDHLQRPILRNR